MTGYSKPLRLREQALRSDGHPLIAGVDEAGRGALAGPVAAAAVILHPDHCPCDLDDSKKLSPAVRLRLFHEIIASAIGVRVRLVGARRIDEVNILRATHEAMAAALSSLPVMPDIALVDGLRVKGLPCPHEAIIGGDGLECSIAAASIIAKVTRDQFMSGYASAYPAYGFERHKGYGVPEHREAIRSQGVCSLHRKTFIGRVLCQETPPIEAAHMAEIADMAEPVVERISNRQTGQKTEALAAIILEKQGYHILTVNWRCRLGEIDIIAEHDGDIVFIEVKSRQNVRHGQPGAAVTPRKQSRIIRAAALYAVTMGVETRTLRFDIVELVKDSESDTYSVVIWPAAFMPGDGYSGL